MSMKAAVAMVLMSVVAAGVTACASGSKSAAGATLVALEAGYAGPPARVEFLGNTRVAIFTAPTGGWKVRRDMTRRRFQVEEVFITLRRPAPGEAVTQALVEHTVDTGVDASVDVAIYARVLLGQDTGQGAPYRLAVPPAPSAGGT